ncbi:MAG: histidine kinase dimerization/phosphoacceptor domain -containing protein [Methanosarcina sp.]
MLNKKNRLWKQLLLPEDMDIFLENEKKALNAHEDYQGEFDYRIRARDGKTKWVHEIHQKILGEDEKPLYTGIIYDITEKKEAEEALAKAEEAWIREIHHRIKNNLQVISSLLDLQAETFSNLETCKTPDVIEAFAESQNRVISMALIHEELYKSKGMDSLDFSDYLQKLTRELFHSYNLRNEGIKLKMELEQAYLGMDTAIPLGIIVNELVSNSLKHAFPGKEKGEISICLKQVKNSVLAVDKENLKGISGCNNETSDKSSDAGNTYNKDDFHYLLKVTNTGKSIPEEIDFQNADSLGFQLVNILVEQIDGCVELEKEKRTEFTIWFKNIDKYVDK